MKKPVAIVATYLVRYPLGGHVLSQLHYLLGLQRLGYEVVAVEHFGWSQACYDPRGGTMTDDPSYGLSQIRPIYERVGLKKWCYIDAAGRFHGLTGDQLRQLCRDSALLLSLASVTWTEEFYDCSKRVFLDTDPGFTQFGIPPKPARSCSGYASPWDFQFHFTIGERIGKPDCPIPLHGLNWRPTRWPIVLDLLPQRYTPDAKYFTTVMSWCARKVIVYKGVEYAQKDLEFVKFIDLPKRVGSVFEIALAGPNAPRERLAAAGWRIADPLQVTATPWSYIAYLGQSRGEFTVAVNLEVKARSGWIGDRTAAYLASGKPVVFQDTGFSEIFPCGEGLFAFKDVDDVVAAIETIGEDYARHCRAARGIAEEYFDSNKILGALLRECGLPVPFG